MIAGPTFQAATGLCRASRPSPAIAAEAVATALSRLGRDRADHIVLFLTAEFANDPTQAVLAAARVGQTTAVTGCTALGVLTEEDWVLDAPAASALVLLDLPPTQPGTPALSLAAPDALDLGWLAGSQPRYGGVAGDATGAGPFKVWTNARVAPSGRCTVELATPRSLHLSQAVSPLCEALHATATNGFDVQLLDGRAAAATLRRSASPLPPLHELALALLDKQGRIDRCLPVIAMGHDGQVTVGGHVGPGTLVRWMHRNANAARADLHAIADQPPPTCALLFSCAGRGPNLFDGIDVEWQILRQQWPTTSLAGFYGNGQIHCLHSENRVAHRSLAVATFD